MKLLTSNQARQYNFQTLDFLLLFKDTDIFIKIDIDFFILISIV